MRFGSYTVLPAVAAVTDRIELSALVTCVGDRNPALLAKMVAVPGNDAETIERFADEVAPEFRRP